MSSNMRLDAFYLPLYVENCGDFLPTRSLDVYFLHGLLALMDVSCLRVALSLWAIDCLTGGIVYAYVMVVFLRFFCTSLGRTRFLGATAQPGANASSPQRC